MTTKVKELGATGFSSEYWEKNYSEPEEMDNIGNAKEHVDMILSLFRLEQVQINSVIDLGFGLGHLFETFLIEARPYRAFGIEPSEYAFIELKKRLKDQSDLLLQTKKCKLENIDLVTWATNNKKITEKNKIFDLGICTSVFQYLKDDEIEFVLPIMAQNMKYLYFSVPTDLEFKRQKEEYEFVDEYAIHRKREKYLKWIKPHFTFVGTRMLESKIFFNDDNSHFKEHLFRF